MTNEILPIQNATNEQLIENTPAEQVLIKINNMRRLNLTAKQKEEIGNLVRIIKECFGKLTIRYFGISEKQAQELNDKELEALFFLIYERARKDVIFIKLTIIGWLLGLDRYVYGRVQFVYRVQKLKKILGDSFNPINIIRHGIAVINKPD